VVGRAITKDGCAEAPLVFVSLMIALTCWMALTHSESYKNRKSGKTGKRNEIRFCLL